MNMKILFICTVSVLMFFIISCEKESNLNSIPYAEVYFEINLEKTPDKNLRTPGRSETFINPRLSTDRVGYSGLLITCSALEPITNSIYQLYAYDLCCPYEKQQNIRVEPIQENVTAKCMKCGSIFNIFNGVGNPIAGPAKENLQVYKAIFQNSAQPKFLIVRK